jgi:hypothetical protein
MPRVRSEEDRRNNNEGNLQRYHTKYKHNPNHRVNAYRWTIKIKYKLDENEYTKLFNEQRGRCPICSKELSNHFEKIKKARTCVDHCHKTGEVRGLLCHTCNMGLGSFNDNRELLIKGATYLEISNRRGDRLPRAERGDEGSLSGGQRC